MKLNTKKSISFLSDPLVLSYYTGDLKVADSWSSEISFETVIACSSHRAEKKTDAC